MSTPAIDPAAVRNLPVKAQRELLDAILDGLGAHGVIHLELPDGPLHRYLPVPNARELAEQSWREATPEELAESARRAATLEHSVSVEEMMRLIEQDVERDEK